MLFLGDRGGKMGGKEEVGGRGGFGERRVDG